MKKTMALILMGSKSDYGHAERIIEWLDRFGVAYAVRIASAHKTPEKLLALLGDCERSGDNIVYITIAGLSNALSGMVDFATVFPVLACPPPSEAFGGADIFSSLRLPPGVAAATLLDPRNAALCAAKILAAGDEGIKAKIRAFQAEQRAKIDADEATLPNSGEAAGNLR